MASLKAQSEIRDRLVALVARHAGIGAEHIRRDAPIWPHFPVGSGRREHPSVASFVHDVYSEFEVYLTEKEWEDPTPDSLAQCIRTKLENPSTSLADGAHDRAEIQRGLKMSVVVLNPLLAAACLLGAAGSWTRRVLMMAGLLVLINAMVLLIYCAESRKMNASSPKKRAL